jgi:hypothetical protein
MSHRGAWVRLSLIGVVAIVGSMLGLGASASSAGGTGPAVVDEVPIGRGMMGLAYDLDRHELVMFGGLAAMGDRSRVLGDTWTWDGSSWTRRRSIASPPDVYGARMAFDEARHEVVLFGGTSTIASSDQTWTGDGNGPSSIPPDRLRRGLRSQRRGGRDVRRRLLREPSRDVDLGRLDVDQDAPSLGSTTQDGCRDGVRPGFWGR